MSEGHEAGPLARGTFLGSGAWLGLRTLAGPTDILFGVFECLCREGSYLGGPIDCFTELQIDSHVDGLVVSFFFLLSFKAEHVFEDGLEAAHPSLLSWEPSSECVEKVLVFEASELVAVRRSRLVVHLLFGLVGQGFVGTA